MKVLEYLPLFLFCLIVSTQSACTKYDEGAPSLKSKKNRLAQKWKVDQALVVFDDTSNYELDVTPEWLNGSIEFTKDGGYEMNQFIYEDPTVTDPTAVFKVETKGDWEFFGKKKQIYTNEHVVEIKVEDNTILEEYDIERRVWYIVKLQKDELYVKYYTPGNDIQHYEFQLSPF
ncbi:hypothetical protein [Crocinitomix catalasitica]|uniref:hypothetical protein n=1 Tax=Crocinitomix catalasitica TaxID=184607 RepID=UPI0004830122|nr:hypothetical protein [Crocinitomix catalasitica]